MGDYIELTRLLNLNEVAVLESRLRAADIDYVVEHDVMAGLNYPPPTGGQGISVRVRADQFPEAKELLA